MAEKLCQLKKKGSKSDILLSNAGDYVLISTSTGLASSGNATSISLSSAGFVINVSKYNSLRSTTDTYLVGSTDGKTFSSTQQHTGSSSVDVSQYILVAGQVGSTSRTITLS